MGLIPEGVSLFLGIGPWEIVLILLIVLILFGPKKLPELAKAVGDAVKNYRKASSGIWEEDKSQPKSEASVLIETAKKMGIQTEGKTLEQISDEIAKAASSKPASTSQTT